MYESSKLEICAARTKWDGYYFLLKSTRHRNIGFNILQSLDSSERSSKESEEVQKLLGLLFRFDTPRKRSCIGTAGRHFFWENWKQPWPGTGARPSSRILAMQITHALTPVRRSSRPSRREPPPDSVVCTYTPSLHCI